MDKWKCPECGTTDPPYREVSRRVHSRYMYILDEDGALSEWETVPFYSEDDDSVEHVYIGCNQCTWSEET